MGTDKLDQFGNPRYVNLERQGVPGDMRGSPRGEWVAAEAEILR